VLEDDVEAASEHRVEVVHLVGGGEDRADGGELAVASVQLGGAVRDLQLELLPPAPDRLQRVLQLCSHRLEALREHADLASLGDAHGLLQVPGGHLLRGVGEVAHGTDEQPGAEEREQPEDGERASSRQDQRLPEPARRRVRLALGTAERDRPGRGREPDERHRVPLPLEVCRLAMVRRDGDVRDRRSSRVQHPAVEGEMLPRRQRSAALGRGEGDPARADELCVPGAAEASGRIESLHDVGAREVEDPQDRAPPSAARPDGDRERHDGPSS
jgi:hypothetical protein